MRLWPRLLLAAAAAVLPAGVAMSSCTTGAVAVDVCRQIEETRCTLAPACTPGFDVDRCQRYYRDECLNGLEEVDAGVDPNTEVAGCLTALAAVAGCLDASTSTADCQVLVPDASCYELDAAATPCNVLLACPELIPACAFVGTEIPAPDAGVDATEEDAASE